MNIWKNTILTEKGQALMSKLTQGVSLEITRAVTGAGFVTPGMLLKVTDVTAPKQELTFRPVSYPESGKCAITVALKNDGLGKGYTATQVGLFATDPDEGEILLFISQSTDANTGTNIPSETEMPGFSSEWTFYLQYGQANGVTVVVDPSNTVTQAVMEEYVAESLKKMEDDIDMGGHKITNVAEPTQGSDVATRHFVEQHTLEGNLYVAVDYNNDGNVVLKPYVADEDEVIFKAHLENKNNPHGATWRQVGAAPAGYGLGETQGRVCNDCNTAVEIGFYQLSGSSCKNVPTEAQLHFGAMLVERRGELVQQVVNRCNTIIRRYSGDAGANWTEWEWVNPPFELNTEYRTTERFTNKPVYAKRINFGIGTTRAVDITTDTIDSLVRVEGCWANGDIKELFTSNYIVSGVSVDRYGGASRLKVEANAVATNYTGYPVVYYTKG